MMRSLRNRLLITLAAVLLAAWASWFAIQFMQMTKRQCGEIDGMLRNVAEQILLSMPADIATAGQQRQFSLESQMAPTGGKFGALGFQVWERGTGRRLMSSKPAPQHAMSSDFKDGYADTMIAGAAWRVFSVSDDDGRVQVQVGLPQSALEAELQRWFHLSLVTAVVLLLVIGVAIWLVIHWSIRPVVKVSNALANRAALDLAPVPERGLPSEFSPLIGAFNGLMGSLGDAMRREREFLSEAAHELRTPLAALLAQAQVLEHAGSREEAREALHHLIAGIERTSRLAQQLLDGARVEAGTTPARMQEVDLGLVVSMVTDEFHLLAERSGQSIDVDVVSAPVQGDIDDLGILVRNLLDNALRHGGPGTRVKLQTQLMEAEDQRQAVLIVADDGPGIAEADQQRIFERFYRAGGAGRAHGTGIGLSLVERVVASHEGQLRCGSGLEGRGFCVEILIPSRKRDGMTRHSGRPAEAGSLP
jgi:two-component system, OmpR family, sensor histidine kinase QseC